MPRERPPRPLRQGRFASFSLCRVHPSFSRRGVPSFRCATGTPLLRQLRQEGWLRHQQEVAKLPKRRRRGGHSHQSVSECVVKDSQYLTTPSAPSKVASLHFFMSRPPLLVELVEEGSSPS